jgi:pimeloyl-ACP methyl ester carboxylesterase
MGPAVWALRHTRARRTQAMSSRRFPGPYHRNESLEKGEPVNDRIVRANGVDLCVETFGDRGDPAILLVHGGGNCMVSWDDELCARLATGGRLVVRYDIRGAGRSMQAAAAPFGLRDLVADAAGLLDALELRQAHVLGMSLGGAVAQLLALDHPDRVASLVLVSTTPGGPGHATPDLPPPADELRAFFEDEPAVPDWSDRAAVIDFLVESERPFGARSRRFDEADQRAVAARVVDHSADIEASLTNAFGFDVGEPWRRRLGDVTAPALVVHGTEDPMFPFAHAVALADEIPGATLLSVPGMGHEYFPRDTWDVVVPAILRHTDGR